VATRLMLFAMRFGVTLPLLAAAWKVGSLKWGGGPPGHGFSDGPL
jgi:hypothetical protein